MAPQRNSIRVFHPDYDPPALLFVLPAADGPNHDQAPYFIVYDAACALANNVRGSLTTSKHDAFSKLESRGWLEAGDYFYHVTHSSPDLPWPVVANFRSWSSDLLSSMSSHWSITSDTSASPEGHCDSAATPAKCQVTGKQLALEYAHIIPHPEHLWLVKNQLEQIKYRRCHAERVMFDNRCNRIWLTRDAHTIWNESKFVIVPDLQEPDVPPKRWRTYRLDDHPEVKEKWHNKRLLPIIGHKHAHLFVRFVRDLFSLTKGFLESDSPRRLVVYNPSNGKYEVKTLTKAERSALLIQEDRSSTGNPTKRKHSAHSNESLEDNHAPISPEELPTTKRQKRSPSEQGRGIEKAEEQGSEENLESESDDEPIVRHRRPTRSPDFLPAWMHQPAEHERGRPRERKP